MVDFQQRKDKDLLLHTPLDFVVTVSTSFQIKPSPLQVCKTLKSTYFHLPDTIRKQFSFFPLLKKFACHAESKNANKLNNAAEKNCVHMYQNFLGLQVCSIVGWVFDFVTNCWFQFLKYFRIREPLVLVFLNLKELVGLGKEPMVLWVVIRFSSNLLRATFIYQIQFLDFLRTIVMNPKNCRITTGGLYRFLITIQH
jgi:hypothetical protein